VFLEAWAGGELAGVVRHDDGQGWALFEIPLGGERGFEVRVRAPDAAERHFCWEAVVRG
jgi:hypothetical protein